MRLKPKISTVFFCSFIILLAVSSQAANSKIESFDLFGFKTATLLKGRLVTGQNARSLLLKRKISIEEMNGTRDVIISVEGKNNYLLELGTSETEGSWLTISDLSSELASVKERAKGDPTLLKEISLTSKDFLPISVSYPEIVLGSTSAAQVLNILGKPDYIGFLAEDHDKLKSKLKQYIWFLKRDLRKEKSCFGSVSTKPPFEAMEVVFTFDKNNKLRKINFINGISGEC